SGWPVEAAIDVAKAVDYFFGTFGFGSQVTRIVVGDPTQVLIDAGIADAAEIALRQSSVDGYDAGYWIMLNHRVAQSEWAQWYAEGSRAYPTLSAVFGDRPVLALTFQALMRGLVGSVAQRPSIFADRVLREYHDGASDPGEYLRWRDSAVPDGGD